MKPKQSLGAKQSAVLAFLVAVTLGVVLWLTCAKAHAAEPTPAVAPTIILPETMPVTVVLKGEIVPSNGLLVPAETFAMYLRQRVALEECTLKMIARDRVIAELSTPAPLPRGPVVKTGTAILVVGAFVVGVAAGIAVLRLAAEISP